MVGNEVKGGIGGDARFGKWLDEGTVSVGDDDLVSGGAIGVVGGGALAIGSLECLSSGVGLDSDGVGGRLSGGVSLVGGADFGVCSG